MDFEKKAKEFYIRFTGTGPELTVSERAEVALIAQALRETDERARGEEREACAKVADDHDNNCVACGCDSWQIGQEIRARSGPMTLAELERLAKAAHERSRESRNYFHDVKVFDVEELDDFMGEADPSTVLSLIEQVRAYREALEAIAIRDDAGSGAHARLVLARFPEGEL